MKRENVMNVNDEESESGSEEHHSSRHIEAGNLIDSREPVQVKSVFFQFTRNDGHKFISHSLPPGQNLACFYIEKSFRQM